jgi:exopolysaccharide production protein ExoQ
VIVPDSATRRPGSTGRVLKGAEAPQTGTPSRAEWWFVYVVLVATAVIPGLATKYNVLGQTQIQIFWSAAYVIAGRQLLLMRAQVLPLVRQSAVLCALLILMFASALWSVNPYTTVIDSIELLGTTVIGLYIATRFTLPEFLRIVAAMFATVAFLSVVTVFLNPGFGRADWGTGAWQGIYLDKNALGEAASLAIISQLALLPCIKGLGRWLLVASLLLTGLLLTEAKSATAFGDCTVVVIGVVAAFGCRSTRFGGMARFATVLGLVIGIASAFVFGLSIDSFYSALGRTSDLTTRADFWPYLQQAVGDRPVLGYGFDAFFQSPVAHDYLDEFIVEAGGWTPYHAHDSYLQTLLDVGYVGLAALVVFLLISFWRAIAYFARERSSVGAWPLAIILFLSIGSYTETYYLNYNSLEWILLIAAVVYPLRSSL